MKDDNASRLYNKKVKEFNDRVKNETKTSYHLPDDIWRKIHTEGYFPSKEERIQWYKPRAEQPEAHLRGLFDKQAVDRFRENVKQSLANDDARTRASLQLGLGWHPKNTMADGALLMLREADAVDGVKNSYDDYHAYRMGPFVNRHLNRIVDHQHRGIWTGDFSTGPRKMGGMGQALQKSRRRQKKRKTRSRRKKTRSRRR